MTGTTTRTDLLNIEVRPSGSFMTGTTWCPGRAAGSCGRVVRVVASGDGQVGLAMKPGAT